MKPICKVFDSGLRAVFTKVGKNRPTSIFVAVGVGSNKENLSNNGISHFVEHLNFKGTSKRTAQQISMEFEDIGAGANAWTSKVATCFYATTLPENMEHCCEILSDIVLNSTYSKEDIDKERKVVYEEIDMTSDDPESVAFDIFCKQFFEGNTLSQSVLGSKESLSKITREDIIDFVNKNYTPDNMVVSIVGDYDKEYVFDTVAKIFDSKFNSKNKVLKKAHNQNFIPQKSFLQTQADFNQTQVAVGFPCDNCFTKDKMNYALLCFILGGSMSSRLFQKVREENSLVYSISCVPEYYTNAGDICIAFGTSEKNVKKALELVRDEVKLLVQKGITDEELARAKTFCKSLLLSSFESTSSIARAVATSYLTFDRFISVDERLQSLQKANKEDINALAKRTFDFDKSVTVVLTKNKVKGLENIFD